MHALNIYLGRRYCSFHFLDSRYGLSESTKGRLLCSGQGAGSQTSEQVTPPAVPQKESKMIRVCLLMVAKFSQESVSLHKSTVMRKPGNQARNTSFWVKLWVWVSRTHGWTWTSQLQYNTGTDQRQDPQFKGYCQKEEWRKALLWLLRTVSPGNLDAWDTDRAMKFLSLLWKWTSLLLSCLQISEYSGKHCLGFLSGHRIKNVLLAFTTAEVITYWMVPKIVSERMAVTLHDLI